MRRLLKWEWHIETLPQQNKNKEGMMAYDCGPSYLGGRGRRMAASGRH
jgi:hypothetical protein